MQRLHIRVMAAALLLVFTASLAQAQLVNGEIRGQVLDESGQSIPDVKVTLTNEATQDVRQTSSNEVGSFVFGAVPPGTWTIRAERTGFRIYERRAQVLTVGQHLAVNLTLNIGQVSEKVTITAEPANVETSNSDLSNIITDRQIDRIQSQARDAVSLLRLLPGVALTGGWADTPSLGGTFGSGTPNISGMRKDWNILSLDGQSTTNPFDNSLNEGIVSMDAIAEARVLQNTYKAEYGRSSGAFIDFVTKSGTRAFHASAYSFLRNEKLNANDFFNNRQGLPRPLFRYTNVGITAGGPIYIPGKFNTSRNKLFFFVSAEGWSIRQPQNPWRVTVPTALERIGDFSQTKDLNGALIQIIDPTTRTPFAGNVIPPSRLNPNGLKILNLFPLPNQLNTTITNGTYNYQYQEITNQPKYTQDVKLDYNASQNDHIGVRLTQFTSDRKGYQSLAAFNSNWPQLPYHYKFPSRSANLNYAKTLSPTLLNEFSIGFHDSAERGDLTSDYSFDAVSRTKLGINIGQFNPSGNPYSILPAASFGGVQSPANISYDDRLPINALAKSWEGRDNFAINRGAHLLKFGVLFQRAWNNKGNKGNFGGSFDFGRNTQNPLDSNYAYSNAALGNFNSYTEASQRVSAPVRMTLWEWFAQDSWKVSRRLTLEYGVRFSWATPYQYTNSNGAEFALGLYNPAQAPQLIRPVKDTVGNRVGQNPITGEIVPAVQIGAFVPGTGNPFNGLITSGTTSYPAGFREQYPVQTAPRFGFALDVFGDGTTALRGGFGITKEMVPSADPMVWSNLTHSPVVLNPVIYYGNLNTFLNSGSVLFPNNVQGLERDAKVPSVYNFSFGIQRNVGAATVLTATYVGNLGRHLEQGRNLNVVPFGARFLPQNADPTNTALPLPDNFFRPYPGYGNVQYVENAGTSHYNGLQVSLNRRFTRNLQYGVSYTWSKSMDTGSNDGATVATWISPRVWNYGKSSFDQTHVFVANYVYDIPKLSRFWNNAVSRQVLDRWELSGVTTFASGFPLGLSYSTTDGRDITGGGDGSRVVVTGVAEKSFGDRSFNEFFNTKVFARPAQGTFGNAPKDVFRGPGIASWDISLFKNFAIFSESRILQFRAEAYNAFNHSQWAGVNTAARFDPAGNQVNAQFGQVTSTRPPRVMQLALRFQF